MRIGAQRRRELERRLQQVRSPKCRVSLDLMSVSDVPVIWELALLPGELPRANHRNINRLVAVV